MPDIVTKTPPLSGGNLCDEINTNAVPVWGTNLTGAINETTTTVTAASTTNIGAAAANNITISGGTTITAFDTVQAGTIRRLTFSAALTITYDATKLKLPGNQNIITNPGDKAVFVSLGSGNWECVSYMSAVSVPGTVVFSGLYKNLKITNGSSPNTQISITADYVILNDANGFAVKVPATSPISITATNSGAGGLDTGSLSGSTWYSIWVIYNPTSGVVAGLISTSATSPTLPAGYTFYARVGWTRTDGTVNKYLLRILQYGKRAQYVVTSATNTANLPIMDSGAKGSPTVPTWSAVAIGNYVPSTAMTIFGVIGTGTSGGGGTVSVIAAPNNGYGAGASTTNPPPVYFLGLDTGSAGLTGRLHYNFVLESTNIYWASTGAGALIACLGWEDNL